MEFVKGKGVAHSLQNELYRNISNAGTTYLNIKENVYSNMALRATILLWHCTVQLWHYPIYGILQLSYYNKKVP
jgi:hypothetical protein